MQPPGRNLWNDPHPAVFPRKKLFCHGYGTGAPEDFLLFFSITGTPANILVLFWTFKWGCICKIAKVTILLVEVSTVIILTHSAGWIFCIATSSVVFKFSLPNTRLQCFKEIFVGCIALINFKWRLSLSENEFCKKLCYCRQPKVPPVEKFYRYCVKAV